MNKSLEIPRKDILSVKLHGDVWSHHGVFVNDIKDLIRIFDYPGGEIVVDKQNVEIL